MKPVWFFTFLVVLFIAPIFARVSAASLKFDPKTATVNAGDTFTVDVVVDPGSEQVTSSDVYILFDKNYLTAESVTDGTYFPTVLNDVTAGRVYIAGLVNDPSDYKTGTGTIAKVTFKAITNGTVTLTYRCGTTFADTSKIIKNDANSSNIITCSTNDEATITIGNGVSTITATPSISSLPTTGTGGTTSTSSSTIYSTARPNELPQSGVLDNLLRALVPGAAFVAIGALVHLIL